MVGLPTGSTVALSLMVLVPVATFVRYWIDRTRNDGYVSIVGRR